MRLRRYTIAVALALAVTIIVGIAYQVLRPKILDYRKDAYISERAERGDPNFQRLLAESLYDKGEFEAALMWEQKSAEGGDPLAQNFLGHYFRYGINEHLKPAAPDYVKAREWYEKSAAQDFRPSQLELCDMYSNGLGAAPDYETGYFWCSLSESTERGMKLRELSAAGLDQEDRLRVEQRVAEWLASHGKNR
jgi:TPR repeat protein